MFCQDCGKKTADGECTCGRSRSRERRERERRDRELVTQGLDTQGSAIVAALNSSLGSKIDSADSKLSALSTTVGELDSKVDHVSSRVDKHDERFSQLDQTLQTISDFADRLKALKGKLAERAAGERAGSVQSGVSAGGKAHQASVTPKEERTIARMGNLGWDLDKAEAVKRAKQVLLDAKICDETYHSLVALHRKGSMVELEFHTPSELRRARFAV